MRRLLPLLALAFVFTGCEIINPDEQEPAFVNINSLSFNAQPGLGTDSHAITEVWVYANGKMLGVYDLPAQIPMLEEGNVDLQVFAGIKNNGIASTRIKYPFYTSFDTTLNVTPLSQHAVTPRFEYLSNVVVESTGFENNENPFMEEPGSDVGIGITNDASLVFEGNASGHVTLQGNDDYLLVSTQNHYNWQAGEYVFAEMNYSCNNTFAVGVVAHNSSSSARTFALIFNKDDNAVGSPKWKKIYIDLGFVLQQNANADYYEFYIECNKQSDIPVGELFFDNIKFVRFN